MSKYINLIGLELEGSWRRIFRDSSIIADPSVRGVEGFRHFGEAVSPPLDRPGIEKWLLTHVPDAVNETCGYHIHVSLKRSRDYIRLTSERFYKLLLQRISEWGEREKIPKEHHFWQRLAGTFRFQTPAGNVRNFCRKEFRPEEQMYVVKKGGEGGARHCHLNFCYSLHGTVELRLFPAWDSLSLYLGSLGVFLSTVDEFLLAEEKRRENKLRIKLGAAVRKPRRALTLFQEGI